MNKHRMSKFLIREIISILIVMFMVSMVYNKVLGLNIFNIILDESTIWIKSVIMVIHIIYLFVVIKITWLLISNLKTLSIVVGIYGGIDSSEGIDNKKSKFKEIDIEMMTDLKERLGIREDSIMVTTTQLLCCFILLLTFYIGCYSLYMLF